MYIKSFIKQNKYFHYKTKCSKWKKITNEAFFFLIKNPKSYTSQKSKKTLAKTILKFKMKNNCPPPLKIE